MTRRTLIGLLCSVLLAPFSGAAERPLLAIIIDDIGYAARAGERAVRLPGPVAFAVLPDAPHARRLALAAGDTGKEVLLHLPLQSVEPLPQEPSGGIELETTEPEFERRLLAYLDSIPHLDGVNTHQGSLLTRHPGHMQWLMTRLSQRSDLFFVDSYTTVHSVALAIADENRIPAARRDVFLDTVAESAAIRAELERAIGIAKSRGAALAIGHPHAATLAVLEEELPRLDDHGVQLVPVRQLIAHRLAALTPPHGAAATALE